MKAVISKVTDQELDEKLRIALEKAESIDETLQIFYEGIMQQISRIMRLGDNSRRNADPLGAYPDGITIMRINIPGMGFPNDFGVVVTNKSGSYGFQFFSNNLARIEAPPVIHQRSWMPAISKWTAWDIPETAGGAQEKANERVMRTGDAMTGFLSLHANPTEPMHAATKDYVDSVIEGLDIKTSVRVATTSNLAVSSSTNNRLNLSSALTSLDGVTLRVGDRILVKDQSNSRQNGIYEYKSSTVLERAEDANTNEKVTPGLYTFVEEGSVNSDSGWVLTTNGNINLGTAGLTFVQFSGAGQIIPGDGLAKDGNTLYIANTGVSAGTYTKLTVNSRGQATFGGYLIEEDIPNLGANKVTYGKFHIDRIPTGLTGTTVALGNHTHTLQQLSNVSINTVAAGHFLRYDGLNWKNVLLTAEDIPNLPASKVSSGVLSLDRIPDLPASKITSGIFAVARIPDLPASKITSGVFNIARIPTGTTSTTVALGNHKHSDYENRLSAIESDLPEIAFGMKGQVPFVKQDNSNDLDVDYLVKEVVVVDNDSDLASAKEVFTSNREIFDQWQRFSHGPNKHEQPGLSNELTGWRYDSNNDLVIATINSASHIGFVSDKKYDSYVHQVTLASDNGDNDTIGVLIAAAVDSNGKMHTLTALRCNDQSESHNWIRGDGNSPKFVWAIVYNYQMPDARIIADGTSALSKTGSTAWSSIPNGILVRIHREGDIIEAKTSEMNETTFNEAATLRIDLSADADLHKFRGPQPYGYTSFSQPNSTFKNIYFSDAANVIYDIRTGQVWVADNNGNYKIDSSRKLADLGVGRILSNESTGKLFFVRNETEVVPIGRISYRVNQSIGAGQKFMIDAHEVFGPTVNARNLIVQATVRDTDSSSPTRGMYINSEAVATVGKDDRYITVANEYTSMLDFDIVVLR